VRADGGQSLQVDRFQPAKKTSRHDIVVWDHEKIRVFTGGEAINYSAGGLTSGIAFRVPLYFLSKSRLATLLHFALKTSTVGRRSTATVSAFEGNDTGGDYCQ
jgi:hypothetical protein